jgi:hypothetical protein
MVACTDDDPKTTEKPLEAKGTYADFKALVKSAEDNVTGVQNTEDIVLEGTITTSNAAHNLPNGFFVQVKDLQEAFKISAYLSNEIVKTYKVGQKVLVKVKDQYVGKSYGDYIIGKGASEKYQVESYEAEDLELVVVKQEGDLAPVTPKTVTLEELKNVDALKAMVGTVVKIEGLQFIDSDKETTYWKEIIDPKKNQPKSFYTTTLTDIEGNTIAVSTYKSASFAAEKVKGDKSGSVIAVISEFFDKPQFILRGAEDLDFTADRFKVKDNFPHTPKTVDTLNVTFNDATLYERLDLEGWFTESVKGDVFFVGKQYSGNNYIQLDAKQTATESWVVSPKLNLDAANSKKNFSFKTKRGKTTNEVIEVFVSSNFNYENGVEAATWEKVNFTLDAENPTGYNNKFTASGNIDLSAKSGIVYVAIKYTCDGTKDGGVFQLDEVKFNYNEEEVPVEPTEPALGFETWVDGLPFGWAKGKGSLSDIEKATDEKTEGDASIAIKAKVYLSHMFDLELNTNYKLSFQYKSAGTSPSIKLYGYYLKEGSSSKEYGKAETDKLRNFVVPASADWKKHEVTFNSGDFYKHNLDIRVYTPGSGDGDKVYFDDVKLEKVTE